MSEHLNNHHRNTLEELLDHQHTGNMHWREVRSLLEAVGTVEEAHNGKVKIHVGDTMLSIQDPGHHNIDKQLVVDLRKALTEAGYSAEA
jgi:hypothetical protein